MIDLNDLPPEGLICRLYTGPLPEDGAFPSDAYARSTSYADVTWPTVTFETTWTGEFDGAVLYNDVVDGRQIGVWTPLAGWRFFLRPLPRPWKVHQSRFRQRRALVRSKR